MGRLTKNFKQTKSTRTAGENARNYAVYQRVDDWSRKIRQWFKIRGKGSV